MKKRFTIIAALMLTMIFGAGAAGFEISDLEWAKDVGARMAPVKKKVYNVKSYGAKGDGVTMNTDAIQAAIDKCHKKGGGVVTFPAGDFLTGSIYVKEGVNLVIPEGTRILGSTDIADYPLIDTRVAGVEMEWPSALINVIGQKNVKVSGSGIVHGQGKVFWDKYWTMRRDYEKRGLRWIVDYDCQRPRTLLVQESEDVTLQGLTFQQAGFWTVQVLYSTYCTVDGVIIQNNIDGHGPSTDGVDIDSSSKILVENCDIDCNDDNFCLKAGRDADGLRVGRPTEYVVIRNCISRKGASLFTCGSETSGGIRYILAHDMKAEGTGAGFLIKSALNRGGGVEHIYVKNIEVKDVRTGFSATIDWNPSYSYSRLPAEYEGKELPAHWVKMLTEVPAEEGLPYAKNIYLSDFKMTGVRTAFNISGNERSLMENFNLYNIDVEAVSGGSVSYAKDWSVERVIIRAENPVKVSNSDNVDFTRRRRSNPPAPVEDVNKVVDNTLDSMNIVKTQRPEAGSSRKGDNPVLFLVGDSTMRTGTRGNGDNGQWGWGYYAPGYFDTDKITVENHALGGTSSRSFYEGLWPDVIKGVKPGDWVIVQLGHNDNGPYDSGRARASIPGTGRDSLVVTLKDNQGNDTGQQRTVYSFGEYMRKYVNEIRAKGAHPVLMSVTMRNSWNDGANRPNMNNDKRVWVSEIAEEMNVPFIDLNRLTAEKYEKYGKDKMAILFYGDAIHTSAFGAEDNAKTAAEGLRASGIELAKYLKPAREPYDSPKRVGDNPVLFTVGDSTVRNQDKDEDGQWGWGSVLGNYFDEKKITVDNQAMAGRSTRTYLDEGRWDRVYQALRPGDFVLIQFGHNDGGDINVGKARGVLRGSDNERRVMKMEATGVNKVIYTFGWYLRKFIIDAKEKGAIPIVLSHTPRNQWDEEGKVRRNDTSYGLWAKEAAGQAGAYFIDLNELSAEKLEKIGKDEVAPYFKNDHTHTSLQGANLNAQSIVDGLKVSDIPLKDYLK